MKILIYNWTQDNYKNLRGGGIQKYQQDIIPELLRRKDIQLTILSSGTPELSDFIDPAVRIVRMASVTPRLERFGIINSPVSAPAINSFGNPFSIISSELSDVFRDFVMKNKFDVIHFNQFEGLTSEVLNIKQDLPSIRIILSMHDYYILCPQVNFLYQGQKLCLDSQLGTKCQSCQPIDHLRFNVKIRRVDHFSRKVIGILRLNVTGILAKGIRDLMRSFARVNQTSDSYKFLENEKINDVFRYWSRFVQLINHNVDVVLAVSERVREIAIRQGVNPEILKVLRLGKKEALGFRNSPTPRGPFFDSDGFLTLVFLGYMTIHKGFFFMLEAFERMPIEMSQRINLVVGAKRSSNPADMQRLMNLRQKLKSIVHYNGYTHDQFDEILKPTSVGILCHLCEDAFPLTALEMHCRRIPLLTSDLGGAPEISGCQKMVYSNGNVDAFIDRIRMIFDGGITHEEYWLKAISPSTVEEHCHHLMQYYRGEDGT